jgi:hypothetical protein
MTSYNKEYYHSHKEKMKEYHRLYNLANKEKKIEYLRQYRALNKDKTRDYQAKTKDEKLLYLKKYREDNKDKIALNRLQNRDKMKDYRLQNRLSIKAQKIKKQGGFLLTLFPFSYLTLALVYEGKGLSLPPPRKSWTSVSDVRAFLDSAGAQLSVTCPEDWYRTSFVQIKKLGGKRKFFYRSHPQAVVC